MTIVVHISDLEYGTYLFGSRKGENSVDPEVEKLATERINKHHPDIVVVTGDFTLNGYPEEYEKALAFLERIECPRRVYVPGNHDIVTDETRCDEKIVDGLENYRRFLGEPQDSMYHDGILIVGLDSTEGLPEQRLKRRMIKDDRWDEYYARKSGYIGIEWYSWYLKQLEQHPDARLRIVATHHQLMPVPHGGIHQYILLDSADILTLFQKTRINLVLMGQSHAPAIWIIYNPIISDNKIVLLYSGSTTSKRVSGDVNDNSFNVIEVVDGRVTLATHYLGENDPKKLHEFEI